MKNDFGMESNKMENDNVYQFHNSGYYGYYAIAVFTIAIIVLISIYNG